MTTPTPMKHALSQQGKTPSQSQQGAAATPPVSTPFSVPHAAFSPRGPRSSPQQFKKSPATATSASMMGHPSAAAVNFDSPSTAAAFSALQISGGLDLGLPGPGGLNTPGRTSEDEFATKLEAVIAVLSRSKGLVSEAGLERLANRLGLDSMWESDGMGVDAKRTLIVAGAALELLIHFSNNIVEKVDLDFPDSTEIVTKHAKSAAAILLDDLKLAPDQSPLTKQLDSFAANFERLAILDKLSVSPGLNLYEAVAGIYESLSRLHQWEMQRTREDPALIGKSENFLHNLVLCTKSGIPAMNARRRVGLSLDYWVEKRLQLATDPEMQEYMDKTEKIWSILIACCPLRDIGLVSPVRVSDKWISADVEKVTMPGDLHAGGPMLDWLEPKSTFLPALDQDKEMEAMQMQAGQPSLLGARLPEVAFHAIFDPPIYITHGLWESIRDLGCGLPANELQQKSYDTLLFPRAPGSDYDPSEPRTITHSKRVGFTPSSAEVKWSLKEHVNTLYIYKPIYARALTELTFSHPQQIVSLLPFLRQFAFLSTLLENSFKDKPDPTTVPGGMPPTVSTRTTTSRDDFASFMGGGKSPADSGSGSGPSLATVAEEMESNKKEEPKEEPLKMDVTLTVHPIPKLQILFPFRDGTANVVLEIRANGQVHVESQNVLDERNAVAPNGRQRRVEDLGGILESMESLDKWCLFLRSRWA
ncbi:mediator of RNA polymerase II transcription subunit 1-domain-containing protein [Bombardia bombarda]|uniref:Mediator of RNA polymerase II transcription subunit 1 n=1 Tax=Bombardia bombarda TaxID=252184 RepID=A0AA39XKW5_9PEZI|nr:mediator of RNA polymerase II transcription subunit 1-domain-containing protein [Bombardia bombarda]